MHIAPQFAPPNLRPRPPSEPLPPGACDTHFHVFGPTGRYPYAAERAYTPADAFLEHYLQVSERVGLERGVLVQPSVYGVDNTLLLDALAAHGDRLRGVAVVPPGVTDDELARLHIAGVRGVRVNPLYRAALTPADLPAFAPRLADLGWHVQVILDGAGLAEHAGLLAGLPVPVVVDHMGTLPASEVPGGPGFIALRRLLADAGAWVKLSAPYLVSPHRPGHDDTRELMAALHELAPDRTLWGSNWPHPGMGAPMPEEGDLLDLLARAVPGPEDRRAILVDNPARLYGFTRDAVRTAGGKDGR
ncbi:putative TIM-barrel fold metal-dependent hydrolase [Thermocatellispora tengchongensis]|uniref:Putative TIM-barrel fold metal-dependent hydrolase n=1 Tax=Thermocatellispora tengchongensis TaxID=1073253 RepID=A0A840PFW1_9ACTN|nr:amidohydrolase family protein [Thermocatellispora tengchongensis]MBB5137879.1 putative TIM-barrel fold metal-dependent hydrolase [Thermocatellispora tengchongensis]